MTTEPDQPTPETDERCPECGVKGGWHTVTCELGNSPAAEGDVLPSLPL